jgi:hypothetical protein
MDLYKKKSGLVLICSEAEVIFFHRSIDFLINELNEELSIRTGFSTMEYQALMLKIDDNGTREQSLNEDEVFMIHQLLNEICHGIFISDFEDKFGFPMGGAIELMTRVGAVI